MRELSPHSGLVYDSDDEYRPEPKPVRKQASWCDGSVRVGIHTSIAGDLVEALESARKLGCNALQIFSGSPRMWLRVGSRIAEGDAERFRARRAELGLGPLVIHANYLINLASAEPVLRVRSIQAFHDEMVRAIALGADFLVVHPGSALGGDVTQALRAVSQSVHQAARGLRFADGPFDGMVSGGLRILIENTSGMGSALGMKFEELRAMLDGITDVPAGVCVDTAHAFEAGYDIVTEQGLSQTIATLEHAVGLKRVAILHVNDSKTPFGSRVDRHASIGQGMIGLDAFRRILTHPRLSSAAAEGRAGRAFILETPLDAPGDDRRNVRAVWELAGFSVQQSPPVQRDFSMMKAAAKRAGAADVEGEGATAAGRAFRAGSARATPMDAAAVGPSAAMMGETKGRGAVRASAAEPAPERKQSKRSRTLPGRKAAGSQSKSKKSKMKRKPKGQSGGKGKVQGKGKAENKGRARGKSKA